jgi:hypothetical protein
MDWWMDLLTTWDIHHLELQVVTVLSLYSTLYISLHIKHSPGCSVVFNSHYLAMASNSGDSSVLCAHVITAWWISHKWTLVNCQLNYSIISLSLSCRAWVNCQPSTDTITNQPLRFTHLNSAGLEFSLYSLGADPIGNTASNSPSVFDMGGCLVIVWISFLREYVYWAVT